MSAETMTAPEAAELLGVHPTTVRRWMDEGRLAGITHPITGRRELDRADVEAMKTDPRRMHPAGQDRNHGA